MGKQWAVSAIASILILGTIVPALTFSPNDVYANPSFTSPDNLTNNAVDSRIPDVAVSGSNVHVVYHEDVSGNLEVFYKKSINAGATFSTPVNLSTDATPSQFPEIAVSGNQVYVVWENTAGVRQVFLKISTDGGDNFGSAVKLSSSADSGNIGIFAEGNNVYVAFSALSGGFNIFFTHSTESGVNFSSLQKLSSTSFISNEVVIGSSGNNVYVVWTDHLSNVPKEIQFRKSTDGGANFASVRNLSNNLNNSTPVEIAVDGSNVHIVWGKIVNFAQEVTDVMYTRSTNDGNTFTTPVSIASLSGSFGSGTSPFGANPGVVASGSTVDVVWNDNVDVGTPSENIEIFLKESTDGGANFGSTINLSSNSGDSKFPQIAQSSLYVVWEDDTPGNFDVFLARSTVADTTSPIITLLGDATVTLLVGEAYTDDGATASDIVDDDVVLTDAIVTVNPVDTSIAATYIVTYDVSDSAGNAATQVTRTVEVITSAQATQNVSDELQTIIDSNSGTPLADKVQDSQASVQTAIVELNNKTPPDNQAAAGNIEGAVGSLEDAIKDNGLDPTEGEQLINDLLDISRQLAVDAINDAISRGADVTTAENKFSEGETARDAGDFKTAAAKYKDAIATAEGA